MLWRARRRSQIARAFTVERKPLEFYARVITPPKGFWRNLKMKGNK